MTQHRLRLHASILLSAYVLTGLTGCTVVSVAGSAVGAAISVGGAVVSTGITVTGKVVGAGVDAATGSTTPAP